jgi:hypothetical protein
MKMLRNTGQERVVDVLRPLLPGAAQFDLATSRISLYAFAALAQELKAVQSARLIVSAELDPANLLGTDVDRPLRNGLGAPRLAEVFAAWLQASVQVRQAGGGVPQAAAVMRRSPNSASHALLGAFGLTTDGLGLAPGNPLSLVQCSDSADEADAIAQWFDQQWVTLSQHDAGHSLLELLQVIMRRQGALSLYSLILHHVLGSRGDELDEDQIIKAATGIRKTVVWRKLYKFQRDAVVGAIDKLNRFGGCIIADSVGLGKTFEALAVIKYHELRNDRVLILCPKRLRDNWTLYGANDEPLA